jgi:hypothetical protein
MYLNDKVLAFHAQGPGFNFQQHTHTHTHTRTHTQIDGIFMLATIENVTFPEITLALGR